ncbi:hypothetical protein LOK49_LG03G02828 [Camellia lanceoleosa]|uniref:Uncharacterized protein n=1 Tax=Camellia lanceoleosa TaxID=1840588 RepID=A0ACC0IET7_9ERIC|nr:hypothetical protein LOK49_LG03G02828 [Camellia lanceoleosa]
MDEEALKRISSSTKKKLATLSYTRPSNDAFPSDPDNYSWDEYLFEYGERCLYSVLRRVDGASVVDKFVMALIGNTILLGRASQFYHIDDWSCDYWDEFLTRRLFESCFVIELFRKYAMKELREADDPIFNRAQNLLAVQRYLISNDTFLFLALVEFFNVTKNQDDPRDNFIDLVLHLFENLVGHPLKPSPNNPIHIDESKPLVDLVHQALSDPACQKLIPIITRPIVNMIKLGGSSEQNCISN